MLDNEPTGTVDNDAGRFDTTDPTLKAPPAPRRRRSAGRPAGPPIEADTTAPAEQAVAEQPAAAEPAAEAAPKAKRTRKRAEAAPAAAETPDTTDDTTGETSVDTAPPAAKKTTRSRKKATEPVPPPAVVPEPVDDVAGEDEDEVAAVAVPATMLLFQAPTAEPAPPRPRRAAGRAAGAPADAAEQAAKTTAKATAKTTAKATDSDADSDAEADDAGIDSADAPAARRRRRGTPAAADAGIDTTEDAQLTEDFYGDAEDGPDGEGSDGDGSDGDGSDGEAGGANRRRRRRGGRGRRGRGGREGGPGEDGEESAESDEGAAVGGEAGPEIEIDDAETGEGGEAGTRRRRRRRRRGEDGDGGGDDPEQTVTRVRTPRQTQSDRQSERGDRGDRQSTDRASDGVTSVRGSTRLEAKKQRRREGREAGRSRVPIATEAEFLARREAVDRVMVVREGKERTQIAVLEDGVLVEHYVNKRESSSLMGDVFLGRVQNVLPSMEAAFIDIGKGRNAVLYAGEVNFEGMEGQPKRIEHALKSGQSVLVQVTKDPVGHKGARLTSQISLPGRYLVYVPEGSMTGISRKLPDNERSRLKAILKKVVPEDAGVIIRTAAEGAAEAELAADVERLAKQWEAIKKKAKTASSPALLHGEPDLTIRVVRDIFNSDFGSLVVAGEAAWTEVSDYVMHSAPDLAERVTHWAGVEDVFAAHRVDEQILKGLDRKVWLPSGGSLVIDRTEAMTVVDVNTGKFTGQGGNLEETVTRNNLEAAEEIVRQLRLRDIGGIIVVDFIDMVLESNRELVLRRLIENLGRDRTKHQVAEVTSLGLIQMTRKKIGQGLLEAFSATCEHCNGRGIIVRTDQQEKAPSIPKPGPGGPPAPRQAGDADAPGGSRSARRRRGRGKGGADGDDAGSDADIDETVTDEALALEAESAGNADEAPVLAVAELDTTAPVAVAEPVAAPTGNGTGTGAVTASADDPDAVDAAEAASAAPKRTRKRKPAVSPQKTISEPEPASV